MKLLQKLLSDNSIVITKAEKGCDAVFINKSDYISNFHDLLNDGQIYSMLKNVLKFRKI